MVFFVLMGGVFAQTPILANGADVRSGAKSEIDVTNINDGYINARSRSKTSKKLVIRTSYVELGGRQIDYRYDLNGNCDWETYSLQSGNGKYKIDILENVDGYMYAQIQAISVDVKYNQENAPFRVSTQNVNYVASSNAVKKAAELGEGTGTDLEKVESIYEYIVETIKYDTVKANRIVSGEIIGYLPDIDDTLATSSGICFDFSSLFAAMLRSQGIPAKLIMGYAALSPNPVYHAWNEIYIENVGWIRIRSRVYFNGKDWVRMDPTFASSNASNQKTQFLSNDKNYVKDREY